MKIIASLTTTPTRINLLLPTIESILNQTLKVNGIELNIPYTFTKTGEKYEIPTWLSALVESTKQTNCEVRVYRTDDHGPITKIAPTLIRYRNDSDVYVWSVDDDFAYPVNMLASLFREHIPSKYRVLTHSCGHWTCDIKGNVSFTTTRAEGPGDFLEGFASVLYPPGLVDDDFENYIIKVCENLDCINSDDIIISNFLKRKNILIYNCGYPYMVAGELLDTGLYYGHEQDALSNQQGGNIPRYERAFNWLRDHNINFWVK